MDRHKQVFHGCRGWPSSGGEYGRSIETLWIGHIGIQQKRAVIDATRISDGRPVMLKLLVPMEGPHELRINRLVSSEPLRSDPRNHCAPLLDVIELPNESQIMVHARLRPFNDPPMQTYGEFVSFFSQLCEVSGTPSYGGRPCYPTNQGIQFLHENNIAHRYVLLLFLLGFSSNSTK